MTRVGAWTRGWAPSSKGLRDGSHGGIGVMGTHEVSSDYSCKETVSKVSTKGQQVWTSRLGEWAVDGIARSHGGPGGSSWSRILMESSWCGCIFLDSISKWEVGRADLNELEFCKASTVKGKRGNTIGGRCVQGPWMEGVGGGKWEPLGVRRERPRWCRENSFSKHRLYRFQVSNRASLPCRLPT